MQLARFIGILIDFGFPGIVGGGLTYHILHSWFAVAVFEVLLIALAFFVAYKAAGKPAPADH